MTNELLVKKRLEVIKANMVQLLRGLANDYRQGRIKSPAELQHKVYTQLQTFYESIGEPTFTPVEAWGPPYSKDHNQMIQQILQDFNTLYAEAINLTEDLSKNFEQVSVERDSFDKRIIELESLHSQIESSLKGKDDILVFKDDFRDIAKFDKVGTSGTAAYISTTEGVLTLNRTASTNFNEFATIRIIKGNGLPGNTHVVRSIDSSLRFDGEEELHINLAHILDSNSDTWFEYELFELTQQAEDITENKDLRYHEPVKWAERDIEAMRCVIQIDLAKAKMMNWISVSPYIPSDRGALAAVIEKIVISDEQGTMNALTFEERFDSTKAYVFASQKCKTITIYLRQTTSYDVNIGHFYFMEINTEDVAVMDQNHLNNGTRIHAPALPSIENLGVSYDSGSQQIVYPVVPYEAKTTDVATKKQTLFTVPETDTNIFAGIEQVPAKRYAIGLRDVDLSNYEFTTQSNYVSQPYITTSPIQEIELAADVFIPELFSTEEDWIQFFISVDNAQTWYPICPNNIYKENVKRKYIFNSNTPKEARLDEYEYIETLTEVHEVRVKIVLHRPLDIEDAFAYTPIVKSYEVQALVPEEVG